MSVEVRWPRAFRCADVTLNVEVAAGPGRAPTLVFINSLGCDLRIWNRVVPALRPHLNVIRYDKRGHGLSGSGTGECRIATHAADLVALIAEFAEGPVFLCGLSIGGLVAMETALGQPELVRGLILCDTAARIGTSARYQDRTNRIRKGGIGAIADEQMERWFSPAFRENHPGEVEIMRNMLVRQSDEGYLGSVAALREADLTQRIGQISAPTLCLVGEHDASTPPAVVRALADGIPGARFAAIPAAGHLPCIEAPEALADHILGFSGDCA
ncbi:3-oxoadipate enol-lactonase [Oceaniglobus trochenteri]|uniref:3-oxoadipate enol-lactonase n=1 Tax=Oceaniglobus trochenteri TaxID=2763260 RepID=UPI001CFFEBD8|nr:3-oxoadipate enol-lactonase [Oceaniglobus trochenteri]